MNKKYTTEQIEFIRDNVTGRSYKELTQLFNKRFGTDLSLSTVTSTSFRYGFKNGIDARFNKGWEPTQFKKGHIPFNKGKKKWWVGGEETQFKKGHIPANYRPVGSERINRDGYTEVKTADPKTWESKHKVLWEEKNGKVPEGYVLTFLDKDKSNITLDNLALVTMAESLEITRSNLRSTNPDFTKTGILIAKVKITQNKMKKIIKTDRG